MIPLMCRCLNIQDKSQVVVKFLKVSACSLILTFLLSTAALASDDVLNHPSNHLSPLNRGINKFINSKRDIDWFAFKIPSPGDITVTLSNLPANYRLDLYSARGVKMGSSNRPQRHTEKIVKIELQPGIYRVKITGVNGAFSFKKRYCLRCNYICNTWTLMAYLDGDNDLESSVIEDLNEMRLIGSTKQVNVVVQLDTTKSTAKRFLVRKNSLKVMKDLGYPDTNMGDPAALESFIKWTKSNYPAKNYLLVLNDHGSGWLNETKSPSDSRKGKKSRTIKAICWDDTNGGDYLTIAELSTALSRNFNSSKKLPILGFDACLMGMVEIDNQIRPYVGQRVASEASEAGAGWPYDRVISAVVSNPNISPQAFSKSIVKSFAYYYTHIESESKATLSAMNLADPYNSLNSLISLFSDELKSNMATYYHAISSAAQACDYFETYYIDLGDFAALIRDNPSLPANLTGSASNLIKAINSACIENFSGSEHKATGTSIFFPKYLRMWSDTKSSYSELSFAKSYTWDEMIQTFMDGGGLSYTDSNNDVSSSEVIVSGVPISGTLDDGNDKDDVYRIHLDSGQTLSVTLTGDLNTDFDLYLYGPSTTSVFNNSNYLVGSQSSSYPDSIVYTATEAGDYYIDVYAGKDAGRGNYTVQADAM